MYSRLLEPPRGSFFLFGPRGVGKTVWLRNHFSDAVTFDLLDSRIHLDLVAGPHRLGERIPAGFSGWVVVDEIQRIPDLLHEVHRLIQSRGLRFALTGSSARKLRRRGTNLLAGRAVTRFMHPLVARELGTEFDLGRAIATGCLPMAWTAPDPDDFLAGYVDTYLREEVQQEGIARNIAAFGRFLEAASFSQGAVLNMAAVARECAVSAKAAEDYFTILEDLLIAIRLPVFTRRAKRRLVAHPKFYFFDAGVFGALRPRGPLDDPTRVSGPALETLVLHHLRAENDYGQLGYKLHYWRTQAGEEVDFVLYGERGLVAIEVTGAERVRDADLRGLQAFRKEYPSARAYVLHGGSRRTHHAGIEVLPVTAWLGRLGEIL